MVKASIKELKNFYSLDEKLRDIGSMDSVSIPEYNGFRVDREHTNIFFVNVGSAMFATSWRENPNSRDVTGLMKASCGEFVLYLPGEPMLVKCEEGSEISLFVL